MSRQQDVASGKGNPQPEEEVKVEVVFAPVPDWRNQLQRAMEIVLAASNKAKTHQNLPESEANHQN
jgi:hypothetical protein